MKMTIDLEILVAWITSITAIVSPIVVISIKAGKLLNRLYVLETLIKKQQLDIEMSQQERRILIQGTLACLEGLHEQGCNGVVTKNIQAIQEFLLTEAHRSKNEPRSDGCYR